MNKPRCPVNNYHRDGQTRFDGNGGGCPVYQPNSFDGPKDDIEFSEPPLRIDGSAQHYNHRNNNDDYVQAGDLYRLMSEVEKIQLINNIVQAMQDVPESIQLRQIKHFMLADKKYGTDIAQGLSIDPQWVHSFI